MTQCHIPEDKKYRKKSVYLDGIMVILLVLLTGVDSLLVASEGPLLLLLELSAAAAAVAVVLFLRGTGFKFGFTRAASCDSGAVKVRLGHQTCFVTVGTLKLLHMDIGGHTKEIQWSEMNEGHRKQQMCVCVFSSVQPAVVRCCTEQRLRLCEFQ
jgi:hypothetical protein